MTVILVAQGMVLALAIIMIERQISMSASLDRLKAAVLGATQKVAALEAQVANPPPTGTPDSELDALSAELEAAVGATVPAPPPAP